MKKKLLLFAALAMPAVLLAAGVIGYQDWQLRGSTPANPASGFLRMWADTASGKFKCITSAGAACYFDTNASASTTTVASGTAALGTSAIASGACATVVTVAATGVATTDNVMADFNADPTATTGYTPSASGILTIVKYPTANNVNFKACNLTGSSITPGAVTLNWRVVR